MQSGDTAVTPPKQVSQSDTEKTDISDTVSEKLPLPSDVSTQTKSKTQYGHYLIYSGQPVADIRSFLESYAEDNHPEYIGSMRIDHIRDDKGEYTQTNRVFAAIHPDVYAALCDDGYDQRRREYDFRIMPYEIREGNHPPDNCGYALYIDLPLKIIPVKECQKQLSDKLKAKVSEGFLDVGDAQLHYPMISRDEKEEEYCGYAVITFSRKTHRDNICVVKVLLDQTKWWDSNVKGHMCRVSWCSKGKLAKLRKMSETRKKNPQQLKKIIPLPPGYGRTALKPGAWSNKKDADKL
jgi:hypothetical protein